MVKAVFFIECDDCGKSYSQAVVCSGTDTSLWCDTIENILHEAWLRERWSTTSTCCICGPCFDANCCMSRWLEKENSQP